MTEGLQTMLLPALKEEGAEHTMFLANCNYNQRQCTLLEIIVDMMKVRQVDKWMDGQTDRQTDRQTNWLTPKVIS